MCAEEDDNLVIHAEPLECAYNHSDIKARVYQARYVEYVVQVVYEHHLYAKLVFPALNDVTEPINRIRR